MADNSIVEIGNSAVTDLRVNYSESSGTKTISLTNYPQEEVGFVLRGLAGNLLLANSMVKKVEFLVDDNVVSEISADSINTQYNVNYAPGSLVETINAMVDMKGVAE